MGRGLIDSCYIQGLGTRERKTHQVPTSEGHETWSVSSSFKLINISYDMGGVVGIVP